MLNMVDTVPQDRRMVLGLDLGVGSIGWCIVIFDSKSDPVKILDIGVRSVPLTTDQSDGFVQGNGISVNQGRTMNRAIRRGYDRYQLRRFALTEELKRMGIASEKSLVALTPLELWRLRSDAATEKKLSLPEIARVLLHISQKRGYKHAKSDMGDKKQTEYVKSVNDRYDEIIRQGLTVGQAIYSRLDASKITLDSGKLICTYRAKGEVFPRAAYEAEFDAIMSAQRKHYPEIFTDESISKLKKIIFYQRPLKSCKHLVSLCDFEKLSLIHI